MFKSNCGDCGFTIPSGQKTCPRCGAKPQRINWFWLALGFFVVFVGLGNLLLGTGEQSVSSRTPQQPATPKVKMETVTIRFEYETLAQCARELNVRIGPLHIMKDTPDEVLGKTREGQVFACNLEETGTRGTYVVGWYWTKQPVSE